MIEKIKKKRGFTLIELVLVIVIISVLAAVAVNMMNQPVDEERFNATIAEMNNLKTAIIGNPSLISNQARTNFGYVGDMGNLPSSLDDLVKKGGQPEFTINAAIGIGMGWNGPYLSQEFSEETDGYKKDAWGTEYKYDQAKGIIISAGSDRSFGSGSGYAQDITKTITKSEYLADISGAIKGSSGSPITDSSWVSITLYYPSKGVETSVATTPTAAGTFYFQDIPVGIHRLVAAPLVGNIGLGITVVTALSSGTNTASVQLTGLPQGHLIYEQGSCSTGGTSNGTVTFVVTNQDTVNPLLIETMSISWVGGPNWVNTIPLLVILRSNGSECWNYSQEGKGAGAASGQRLVLRKAPIKISASSSLKFSMVFYNTQANPINMQRTSFEIVFELSSGPARTISFASP